MQIQDHKCPFSVTELHRQYESSEYGMLNPDQRQLLTDMLQRVPDKSPIIHLIHTHYPTFPNIRRSDMHACIRLLNEHTPLNSKQIETLSMIQRELNRDGSKQVKHLRNFERESSPNLQQFSIDPATIPNQHAYLRAIKRLNPTTFKHVYHDQPYFASADYELGWQQHSLFKNTPNYRMHYIKFYDLCMVDYDNPNESDMRKMLTDFLQENPEWVFRVYRTTKGFHIFVLSHVLTYDQPETAYYMHRLGCDDWYITFAQKNGFKVRLNHKPGDKDMHRCDIIGDYVDTIGNPQLIIPELYDLCMIYETHVEK